MRRRIRAGIMLSPRSLRGVSGAERGYFFRVVALFLVGCELTRATLKEIRGKTFWLGIGLWLTAAPLTLLAILYFH